MFLHQIKVIKKSRGMRNKSRKQKIKIKMKINKKMDCLTNLLKILSLKISNKKIRVKNHLKLKKKKSRFNKNQVVVLKKQLKLKSQLKQKKNRNQNLLPITIQLTNLTMIVMQVTKPTRVSWIQVKHC